MNVVYLITCTICNLQYVGSTTTAFRTRFNNHKCRIGSKNPTYNDDCSRLYSQFNAHSEPNSDAFRAAETRWIWRLQTASPCGFNVYDGCSPQTRHKRSWIMSIFLHDFFGQNVRDDVIESRGDDCLYLSHHLTLLYMIWYKFLVFDRDPWNSSENGFVNTPPSLPPSLWACLSTGAYVSSVKPDTGPISVICFAVMRKTGVEKGLGGKSRILSGRIECADRVQAGAGKELESFGAR